MAKPNYRHAKKQKEAARKARQDAKQQRKAGLTEAQNPVDAPAGDEASTPRSESGSVGGGATPAS